MVAPDGGDWRAFTGELTGGNFDFVVEPSPIPTTSTWGMCILALGFITVAAIRLKSIARIDSGTNFLSLGDACWYTTRSGLGDVSSMRISVFMESTIPQKSCLVVAVMHLELVDRLGRITAP